MIYSFKDTDPIPSIAPVTQTGSIVTIQNNPEDRKAISSLSADIVALQPNGYDSVWVGGAGKNKCPNITSQIAGSGITATWLTDGTLKLTGTASGNVFVGIQFSITAGSYVLSGCPSGGGDSTYQLDIRSSVGSGVLYSRDIGSGLSFSPSADLTAYVNVRVANGYACPSGGLIFKPMIRKSTDSADFAPYENICPISGHTDVVVVRANENLAGDDGHQWNINSSGKIESNNQYDATVFKVVSGQKYTITFDGSGDYRVYAFFEHYPKVGDTCYGSRSVISTSSVTVTATINGWCVARPTIGEVVTKVNKGETALATAEDTDVYTIDLDGTRYGGTLDVTSGVLTVDKALVTYTGAEATWQRTTGTGFVQYFISQAGCGNTSNAICNRFKGIALADRGTQTGLVQYTDGSVRISLLTADVSSLNVSTIDDWKTWLSNNNVQVVYELATPLTVNLTAQEIELLQGANNVWASTGDITVTSYVRGMLPAEAVSINHTYLEDIIHGYKTLYVKGRESLGTELNTYSVGTANGEKVKGSRYPARVLTVGFQILAPTNEDFRFRFNQLNNILSIGEADFVFNDEQDKYFTGYPVMDAEVEAGRNNVTGEWKIYCAYPFKRSIEPITLSSKDASGVVVGTNSATFTFDYDGVIPAKPLLRCEFASAKSGGDYTEDGDCGFVAFLNPDESIIQLGNPDVINVDATNKNATLINSEFSALTNWTASGITVGSIKDEFWNNGEGQTASYATGTGTLTRSVTSAIGFEFDIVHRLCVSAPTQTGTFKVSLKNGANTVVGFNIEKTGSGTTATVKYILNNAVVGTDDIDISYYNTNFGYCNRTAVYTTESYTTYVKQKKKKKKKKVIQTRTVQSGWNYTQSNLNSGISRDGGVVTFSIGELADRTFKNSSISTTAITQVVLETTGSLNTNAVRSCALVSKKGVPFAQIPNVFTAGDIVEADCNDANVYLYRAGSAEGHLEAQYGALGNDWEDFEIKVGTNVIRAVWSSWVNTSYKPTVKIIFNKVYI